MNDNEKSFLLREESEAIKGFLILLIILGHNMFFTYSTDRIQLMGYLYCFHIQTFFLLPFLYPLKSISRQRGIDHAIRYYVPFYFFLSALTLLYAPVAEPKYPWWCLPLAGLGGGGELIRQFAGNQLLWFLPAMFATTILKECWPRAKGKWTFLLLAFGVGCVLAGLLKPLLSGEAARIANHISFWGINLFTAGSFLLTGLGLRFLVRHKLNRVGWWIVLFLIGSVAYFWDYFLLVKPYYSYHAETIVWKTLQTLMPIIFCMLLFLWRKSLASCKWLQRLGNHTFVIYLIHPFIGYALFALCRPLAVPLWIWIIPAQLIMIFIPLWIAESLAHFPRLDSLLFPQNKKNWLNAFRGKIS